MPKVIAPLLFANDNSYGIGAAGAGRPNAVYVGGFVAAGLSPYTLTLGSSSGGVYITPSATDVMQFGTAGTPRFNITASGHLLAATDNAYDIGAAGATRPRTVYAATSFVGPGAVPPGGTAGQVLSKVDATSYNLAWITPASGGGGITLPLGQHLLFSPDATYDVGASGASRPRDIYLSGAVRADNLYANSRLYANSWESTGSNSRMTARMNVDGGTDTLIITNAWANRESVLNVMPQGTGVGGGYRAYHASDVNNSAYLLAGIDAAASYLDSSRSGTGVSKALSLRTQGTERWQISAAGHLLAGAENTYDLGQVGGAARRAYVYDTLYMGPSASPVAAIAAYTGTAAGIRVVGAEGMQLNSATYVGMVYNALLLGDATWMRMTTNPASYLYLDSNGLKLYTAPSASAAVAPTWAQVLTVDAGGNLSVSGSLSSSGGALQIAGAGQFGGYTTFVNPGSAAIADPTGSLGGIQIAPSSGGGASMMCFHRPGSFATYFGVDIDNLFKVGGWSMGAAAYRLILGDGYNNNGGLSLGGTNVGSNGVLLSVHANYYGGVYYSTTSAFVGWPSEGRFKTNVGTPANLLAALVNPKLRGIEYNVMEPEWTPVAEGKRPPRLAWKGVSHEKTRGFKAEDWAADFPDLVMAGPGDVRGFNLTGMIPITWEALREVYAEVQALRARVEALEA
jgi:hypothetical protein